MKLTKFANLLMIGLVLSFAVTGCKSSKPNKTPLPEGGQSGSGMGPGSATQGGTLPGDGSGVSSGPGGGDAASFNPDDMNQDRGALAAQTLYFDYDSASVRPDEQSKLSAVASALQSDPSAKLLIEGHCDERGTDEYNRSLGERRALAAREALAGMGLSASRVATRSFGEDRPALLGHDQSAWTKNRRDEFVLLHPK